MKKSFPALAVLAGLLLFASAAIAQVPLVIGSGNTATPDAFLARPKTTPCDVQLFKDVISDLPVHGTRFTPILFTFNPPVDCPGPWSKIVFVGDFSVEAGRQLDRTFHVWLGGTNIFYGTSMEPSPDQARTMHMERDLTDYSMLFHQTQPGVVVLNLFGGTDPDIIGIRNKARTFGSAVLQFYPASSSEPAPATPDMVLPMSRIPNFGLEFFVGEAPSIIGPPNANFTRTFTFPKNIERIFLDIIPRNTSEDEFDYIDIPDPDVANGLQEFPESSFREVEISIDGQPAGLAMNYPRTTEGSIDPLLWRPTPGLQTLNYLPFRLDLTPFAGILNDGQPHNVTIDVINAAPFALNGALLLFLDHGSSQVTGGIELNTFTHANPIQTETKNTVNGDTFGNLTISSAHDFVIRGFVNTSHGRVSTELAQKVNFVNSQDFRFNAIQFTQIVRQQSSLTTVVKTESESGDDHERDRTVFQHIDSPMAVDLIGVTNPDGTFTQTTTMNFSRNVKNVTSSTHGDHDPKVDVLKSSMFTTDQVLFSPEFDIVSNQGQASSQELLTRDSKGNCFNRKVTTANGVLTSVDDGDKCHDRDRGDDRDDK
jgi:hypothetical protein